MSSASRLGRQVRAEQRLFWRNRAASFFTLLLPVMFLAVFGVAGRGRTVDDRPYADFFLPGMLGMAVVVTTFAGLAITLTVRRERGILKRMRGTPLPPAEYLGGLVASTVLVLLLETVVVLVAGPLLFDVPVPSRPWEVLALVALGAAAFAALGIALSPAVPTAEGSSAVVNAVYLPLLFLSGAFFPTDRLPEALQWLTAALPLAPLLDALRAAYVGGGVGGDELRGLLVVLAWAIAGVVVARRAFRWEPRVG